MKREDFEKAIEIDQKIKGLQNVLRNLEAINPLAPYQIEVRMRTTKFIDGTNSEVSLWFNDEHWTSEQIKMFKDEEIIFAKNQISILKHNLSNYVK